MLTPIISRAPVTRRGPERIARWIDVSGGMRHYQVVIFPQPIVWIRESTATLEVRSPGSERQVGSTHNDFYGLLTSPDDHIAAFRAVMAREDITEHGRRELAVVVEITDTPVIEDREATPVTGHQCYRSVPLDWMNADDPGLDAFLAATPDQRAAMGSPYLRPPQARRIVLLSSRWNPSERTDRSRAAVAEAVAELDPDLARTTAERLIGTLITAA